MISLGSVLRDSYLAVPALCLPPKSMLHLASASQLCILIDQCCIRRKRGIGDAPSPSSLCSPLTWALCEISLWPPAEWSQLLLDNVRTCLYLHKNKPEA